MTDKPIPSTERPDKSRPLTEEKGLPPVRETPPMPPAKPPKQSK